MGAITYCLSFQTIQGLYVVTDIYPFHLQARKVHRASCADTLTIDAIFNYVAEHMDDGLHRIALFIALCVRLPCGSGKVRPRLRYTNNEIDHTCTSWRWAYGIGCLYGLAIVLLIAFFMEETWVTSNYAFNGF